MNDKNDDNLDKIVELITEKVSERLKVEKNQETRQYGLTTISKKSSVGRLFNNGASRVSTTSGEVGKISKDMAAMIDHTLLKPEATKEQLKVLCEEAIEYNFATCCVNSSNIPYVAKLLQGSDVLAIAVIGFPLGAASTQSKVFETQEAVKNGAREIDMVINIGALKSKEYHVVYEDIKAVVDAAQPHKVKVILETGKLSQDEKRISCALSKTAGAAFGKTSTGFGKGGATADDISLMRRIVGSDMEVKASGGIRTKADAEAMIKAGADRIGASASIAIVTGKNNSKKGY